jgi:hypothetical protein
LAPVPQAGHDGVGDKGDDDEPVDGMHWAILSRVGGPAVRIRVNQTILARP